VNTELCENSWTDRDTVWNAESSGTGITWGCRCRHEQGHFWGRLADWKAL